MTLQGCQSVWVNSLWGRFLAKGFEGLKEWSSEFWVSLLRLRILPLRTTGRDGQDGGWKKNPSRVSSRQGKTRAGRINPRIHRQDLQYFY